ncbi:MAG: permease [Actinomycetes bacterium]
MSKIWSGLHEGGWMFYDTFWALILGFTLSGMVQAFISRDQMKATLGDHRPATIVKSSIFGIVSSSCSYAASALARSLISKGADFTASIVFMFASTNLVIELGFVIWILIGWQFAVAEFVGGTVMIILISVLLPRVIPASLISQAQSSVDQSMNSMMQPGSPASRFKSRRSWSDAAGFTIGDFTMLRKELVIGFAVAGLASSLVSVAFWQGLFITGHGFWSALENAIIGPFLAFVSFVCSVGNVPLAAALWHGGITFGGVIAFIFADLVAFPLVMIYRKYYGAKLALRLTLLFWFIMSTSGLITEGIFTLVQLVPVRHMNIMNVKHFGANSTTYLNAIALIVICLVYWLYRTRDRNGASIEFAKDLVCGMQVRISDAPAIAELDGTKYYFCMVGCKEEFLANSAKYVSL